MSFLLLPALSLLLLLMLACAFLPFLALWDRLLGRRLKRAAFDKSTVQLAQIALFLQTLLALLLGADLVMHGVIDMFSQRAFRLLWLMLPGTWGGAAFLTFLAQQFWVRSRLSRGSTAGSHVFLALSGLLSLAAAFCSCVLVWLFLRRDALDPAIFLEGGTGAFLDLMASGGDFKIILLFLLLALATGLVMAQGICLIWYLVRRRRDDFGRDYYSQMIGSHARQAGLAAGLLMLPLAVAVLLFTPDVSAHKLPSLLPLAPEQTLIILHLCTLGMPLAALCWHFLGRAALPLRRKFLLFLAPVLLWIGNISFMARAWL